jgi:riboflavin synthase
MLRVKGLGSSGGDRQIEPPRYHPAVFSGIVEGMRPVVALEKGSGAARLRVDLQDLAAGVRPGDSIAVDGCCLTVAALEGPVAGFDVVGETLRLTTLGGLRPGSRVNVERSLRIGDTLGGHFVTGHVEGIGAIVEKEVGADETRLVVELPDGLAAMVLHKGSIALDGVSLTVTGVRGSRVSASLVPYTLAHTTLGTKGKGDRVHVECDLIGKWVKQLLPGR